MPVSYSNKLSKDTLRLFTDGSVDVKTGIGYGACLIVTDQEVPSDEMKKQVKIRRFENTSSTRLELETLLWALSSVPPENTRIKIYTDSQNIIGLPGRRKRFEQNDYHSKNGRLISNHDLYMEFFRVIDLFDIELIKAKGHQPTFRKDEIHRLFAFVDKASRKALRNNN